MPEELIRTATFRPSLRTAPAGRSRSGRRPNNPATQREGKE